MCSGETPGVEQVVLAHPYKTRLIAEAQIKTDKVDARALAMLLRGDLVAQSHAPSAAARQRGLDIPQVTDLFGARGRGWLATVRLPTEADQPLLEQDLEVLRLLEEKITQADKLIGLAKTEDERLLESFPGIGPVFSAVIASEIDGIGRFASAARLSAYASLVPATHASGGRVYQGRLLWACNKWLRWALVEASWERHPAQRLLRRALSPRRRRGQAGEGGRASRRQSPRQKQQCGHRHGGPPPVQNPLVLLERAATL